MASTASSEEIESAGRDQQGEPGEALDAMQSRWLKPLNLAGRVFHRTAYFLNRLGMSILYRLEVSGLSNLPAQGPYILAPNHASSLDSFALASAVDYALAKQTWWVARKRAVTRNRLQSFVARFAQVIPIDRDPSAIPAILHALNRGRIVILFPEGHRSETGRLQQFHPGVGILAVEHELPVIPVAIMGAHEAWPPKNRWPKCFRGVRIRFGEPLRTAADHDPQDFAGRVRAGVEELMKVHQSP